MSFYKQFGTSEDLEVNGIWLDYGDAGRIKIARAGGANRRFATVLERKTRPYRRALDNGTIDPKVIERVMAEVFAETVILGWEDVIGRDGEPLPYTFDNVVQLLLDLPDLFLDIQAQAQRAALFLQANLEAAAKN
jgi:hypothetical protein